MNEDPINNAVSIYGPDAGAEDFPVLKAFQQYIDAEQNKARKRMVYLAIFFGCLMTIVIAVFMFMMHSISMRNQQLNDRLVEFAMKERDRQPVYVQPPVQQTAPQTVQNDAAMKAVTDTLVALQRELAAVKATPAAPKVDPAVEQAKKEEIEKLKRANALLKEEKLRLAKKEKELKEVEAKRKHEEEIEKHRRRLYPEYYAQQDAAKAAAAKQKADEEALKEVQKLEDAEDEELINEFKKGATSNWTFPK